jgi:hypothetical protein
LEYKRRAAEALYLPGTVAAGDLREAVFGAGFAAAYFEAHLACNSVAWKTPSRP